MGTLRMRLLALVLALASSCVVAKKRVFCLQDLAEPSLLEIVMAALPMHFSASVSTADDEDRDIISHSPWKKMLNLKVPLISIFSSGEYRVKFSDKSSFVAQNVVLVQESFASFNVPCRLASAFDTPFLKDWCSCAADARLGVKDWAGVVLPTTSSEFCLSNPPCTSNDYAQGLCEIFVADPFRTSCVVIDADEVPRGAVSYSMVTPSMLNLLPPEDLSLSQSANSVLALFDAVHPAIRESAKGLLAAVPLHAVFLICGLAITIYAKDLAENVVIQTAVQSVLGLSLALLILAVLLYRPIENIVNRYGGLVTAFFPFSVLTSVVTVVYRNPHLGWRVLGLFYSFWVEGALGLPWLGKVYFLASIGLSCGVCWYFQWFEPDARLWPVMLFIVRAVGWLLLGHASSSRDLALMFVVIGVVLEQVWPHLELLALVLEARQQKVHAPAPPPTPSKSRGMSKADAVAELSRKATEEALAKLREHLQSNQADLNKVTNKLLQAGDKNREALLVDRFVKGAYSGLPCSEEEKPKRSWWCWSSIFRVCAIAGAALAVLWVVVKAV